jgi:hypothetical protein
MGTLSYYGLEKKHGTLTVNMLRTNNYPDKHGTYLLCHKKHTHTFPRFIILF